MKKRSIRRAIGQYIGIGASATLAVLGVVALRHALNTPQPLKSSLPGEALLYNWRRRSVFYKVLGDASAPPLVLLHTPGIGASAQEMQPLMEPLAQTYRVYAPDLPGFGLSDRPGIEYSALMYTEFCQDFLRDVVREPATLVASQLSCNYAVSAAAGTPELCAALVMISPLAFQEEKQPGPPQTWAEQPIIKALLYPLLSTRLAFLLMRRNHQGRAADFASFYAITHQLGAEHAAMALLAGRLRKNIAQQFGALRQPVLLIWGIQALEDQRNLAMLRGSTQTRQTRTVELISKAGLAVQEEQPDRVIAAIQSWQVETMRPLKEQVESKAQTISTTTLSNTTGESSPPPAMPIPAETPVGNLEDSSEKIPDFIELEHPTTLQEKQENNKAPANMLAYCVKCRKKTGIQNASEFTMKNGRLAVRGICPTCGSSVTRIGGLS